MSVFSATTGDANRLRGQAASFLPVDLLDDETIRI